MMRRLAAAVLVGVLTAVLAPMAQITPTWATWTNSGDVQGTTFTTYVVPTTTLTCAKSGSTTVFTWTAVSGATNYTISFAGGTAKTPVTQTGTSYTDSAPSANRVASVKVNRAFTSVTWTSVASNTRTESASNGTCA
jgi:hypothetical protein